MLEAVNYSMIESDQLLTFGEKITGVFSNFNAQADAYTLAPFVSKMIKAQDEYSKAYERDSKNPYTLQLVAADRKRDGSFLAFRNYAVACSHRAGGEGWNQASDRIIAVISKHGWRAYSFGYKAQTAAIIKIVNEVRDFYMADITLLGANEWFDQMAADEEAFDALQKQSDTRTPSGLPMLVNTRPVLVAAVRNLLNLIDAHYTAAPDDATLTGYVNALNEIITSTMSLARANQTRSENQKKKDADDASSAK
jgi:hypothetical protein